MMCHFASKDMIEITIIKLEKNEHIRLTTINSLASNDDATSNSALYKT
jgi:hypothetical protein